MFWLNRVVSYVSGTQRNRHISPVIEASNGWGDGIEGNWMKNVLAIPPAQGADPSGVVDRNGPVSRMFCPGDRTRCLDIVWGILDALVVERT